MDPETLSSARATADTFALVTHSPEETQRLGARLAALLQPGDVIALQGELGSGKTQFVKGLARGLGVHESVHSPTFILANEHRSGRLPLFHVDAYRISTAAEAIGFGLEDYLDADGVTAVEWAERISSALPDECLWIEFRDEGETDRRITMWARGPRYRQLLGELSRVALRATGGSEAISPR